MQRTPCDFPLKASALNKSVKSLQNTLIRNDPDKICKALIVPIINSYKALNAQLTICRDCSRLQRSIRDNLKAMIILK